MVSGAIRTDLILSAEIMVIALNEVAEEPFLSRLAILVVVAIAITIAVYGVVAIIVKLDDVGLALTQRSSSFAQKVGHALVVGTPRLLAVISVVGVAAMLWVGGHIVLNGLHELGWDPLYDLVHHAEEVVHHGVQGWLVNTALSAILGLVLGLVDHRGPALLPFGRSPPSALSGGGPGGGGGRGFSRNRRPVLRSEPRQHPPPGPRSRHGLQGRRPQPGRLRPHRDPARRARDARPDGDARAVRRREAPRRRPDRRLAAHDDPDRGPHRDPGRARRRGALGVLQHLLHPGPRGRRDRGRPGGHRRRPAGCPGLRLEGRDPGGVLVVHPADPRLARRRSSRT